MLKKLIYNLNRWFYVRKITHENGKCIFSDDIVCYVKEKALKKYKKSNGNSYCYEIDLTDDNAYADARKQFDLEDKICYIFDGINFDFGVKINVESNAKVEFQNCTFNGPIEINGNNLSVVFRHCKYSYENPYYVKEQPFFKCHAKRLLFVDGTFYNSSPPPRLEAFKKHTNFGMDINVDSLKFINTNINIVDINSKINIKAKDVLINNNIACPSIIINCESLTICDVSIKSEKDITVNCSQNNPLKGLAAPQIIYNGQRVTPNDEGEIGLPTEPTDEKPEDSKANLVSFRKEVTDTNEKPEPDKRIGLSLV